MTVRLTNPTALLLQAVAWLLFLLLPGIFRPGIESFGELLGDLFRPVRYLSGIYYVIVFYVSYLYLVPHLLVPRRYVRLAAWMIGMVVGFMALQALASNKNLPGFMARQEHAYGFPHKPPPDMDGRRDLEPDRPRNPEDFPVPPRRDPNQGHDRGPGRRRAMPGNIFNAFGPGASLYQFLITVAAAFALGLAGQWRREREQRLAGEVSFLRAQTNPHFLFNTLNTLYALTLSKSDKAPEAVLRLATMMRYSVAQAGQARVPLTDELAYLEGYLELQRLRLPEAMRLAYQFPKQTGGAAVAPLLLIIPIENAFTHGVGQEEGGHIRIGLTCEGQALVLDMENSIPQGPKPFAPAPNTGTGLRRLREYLSSYYPGRHTLAITQANGLFHVTLTLTLDG